MLDGVGHAIFFHISLFPDFWIKGVGYAKNLFVNLVMPSIKNMGRSCIFFSIRQNFRPTKNGGRLRKKNIIVPFCTNCTTREKKILTNYAFSFSIPCGKWNMCRSSWIAVATWPRVIFHRLLWHLDYVPLSTDCWGNLTTCHRGLLWQLDCRLLFRNVVAPWLRVTLHRLLWGLVLVNNWQLDCMSFPCFF